ATKWSSNKSPPPLPAPEICPLFQPSFPAIARTNRPPARCTAPQSKCLLWSGPFCFPSCRTTPLPASAIRLQFSRLIPFLPHSNCDSLHAPLAQTTIPRLSPMDALPAHAFAPIHASPACLHKIHATLIINPTNVVPSYPEKKNPDFLESFFFHSISAPTPSIPLLPDDFLSSAAPTVADRRAAPSSSPPATPRARPPATFAQLHQ